MPLLHYKLIKNERIHHLSIRIWLIVTSFTIVRLLDWAWDLALVLCSYHFFFISNKNVTCIPGWHQWLTLIENK